MSVQHLRIGSRLRGKLLLATAAASLLAGCADSSRISDPFGNPFGSSAQVDRSPTGSVPQTRQPRMTPAAKASTGAIESTPLPAPSGSAPATSTPPKAAFTPPAAPVAPVASAAPRSTGATSGNWSAQGGTPIVVAQGENLKMIGERYGVPTDALLKTNGFASAAQVQPGARMTIPVYSTGGHASAATPAAAPFTAKPAGKEKLQLVKGPAPAKAVKDDDDEDEKPAKAAKPSKLDAKKAKVAKADEDDGEDEKPAAKSAKPAIKPIAKAEPVKKAEVAKKVETVKKIEPVRTARVEPAPAPAVEAKKPAVDPAPTASVPPVAEKAPSESANPEFRWPARGRVIQGFKSGGNDGINIAVPEGTAVKAAEDGVVAYAGSELKGYGNLVLIRHPNGFVSAYAHNGALDVKRGETVKRGQTIAKSGQSGNVSSPQLHFELRKGSTPVDPSNFLAGI